MFTATAPPMPTGATADSNQVVSVVSASSQPAAFGSSTTTSSLFGTASAQKSFTFGGQARPVDFSGPMFSCSSSKSLFQPIFRPPVFPQPINYSVMTVHDSDYGNCLQFDLALAKLGALSGFGSDPTFKEKIVVSFTSSFDQEVTKLSNLKWLLKVEVVKQSSKRIIVRAYLCNPEETSNKVALRFIMCLVHNSIGCSCEDMESHLIEYGNVPTGKGHGFEWQYSLNKFQSLFVGSSRLSLRLKMLEGSDGNDTVPNWQVIKNYGQPLSDEKTASIMANYESMINDKSADFHIVLEDGRTILAHKLILSFQWPYFKRIQQSNAIDANSNRMTVVGHDYETILSIVRFLYSGNLTIKNVEHAFKLYQAAHPTVFELESVLKSARTYLAQNLQFEHLLQVLTASDQLQYDDIKEICKRKLIDHKRSNKSTKIENYPGYEQFQSYGKFQQLMSELLTYFYNEIN